MVTCKAVVVDIQYFFEEHIFDRKQVQNHEVNEYKQTWIASKALLKARAQELSSRAPKDLQEYMKRKYPGPEVQVEAEIQPIHRASKAAARFDFFVQEDACAIEVCLSAISHEYEKDILKALSDERVQKLVIMVRSMVSGGVYYGPSTCDFPIYALFKETARVYRVNVEIVPLLPPKAMTP